MANLVNDTIDSLLNVIGKQNTGQKQLSCCEATVNALALFSEGRSKIGALTEVALFIEDAVTGQSLVDADIRLAEFVIAAGLMFQNLKLALNKLSRVTCNSSCCAEAALALARITVANLQSVGTAAINPTLTTGLKGTLALAIELIFQRTNEEFDAIFSTVKRSSKAQKC